MAIQLGYNKKNNGKLKLNSKINPNINKTKKDESSGFFKGSSAFNNVLDEFDDGYQFGDLFKTLINTDKAIVKTAKNTVTDIATDVGEGFMRTSEGLGDWLQYRSADVLDFFGNEDLSKSIRENADADATGMLFGKAEEGNLFGDNWTEGIERNSLIGDKLDQVNQGIGNIAAMAGTSYLTGGNAVSTAAASYTSAYGNARSEAKRNGASDSDANKAGVIGGISEAISEQVFSGIPGLKTAGWGDKLAGKLSGSVAKQFGKTSGRVFLSLLDAAGEGSEEIISNLLNTTGTYIADRLGGYEYGMQQKSGNYIDDIVNDLTSKESWDAFLSASLSSMLVGGGNTAITNIQKNNAIRNYAKENNVSVEQATKDFNKIVNITTNENLPTEANFKDKTELEDKITKDLTKATKNGLNLNTEAQLIKTNEENKKIGFELTQEEQKIYENDEIAKNIYDKAMQKGANNSKEAHKIINDGIKIAKDINLNLDFTNNQDLAEQLIRNKEKELNRKLNSKEISELEEKASKINGMKVGDNILLNLESNSSAKFVLGHEMKHFFEQNKQFNDELNEKLVEWAKAKGIHDQKMQETSEIYANIENANILDEVTADYIGEFFSSEDSMRSFAKEDYTTFEKIANYFKKLYYKVTNQKEKLLVQEINERIQKVYSEVSKERQNLKIDRESEVNINGDEKYSIVGLNGLNNLSDNNNTERKIKNMLLDSYKQAIEMYKNKNNRDTIYKNTYWYKDLKTNKWKIEIPDNMMNIRKNKSFEIGKEYTLSDVIDNKLLFAMYPEFKDYKFTFKDYGEDKLLARFWRKVTKNNKIVKGAYDSLNDEFIINKKLMNKEDSLKYTLIHEIQHAIQKYENFEDGSNTILSKEKYYKDMGEAEARTTSERLKLNLEQRRNGKAPYKQQEENQKIVYDKYINERGIFDLVKDSIYNKLMGWKNEAKKKGFLFEEINDNNIRQNREESEQDENRLGTSDSSFNLPKYSISSNGQLQDQDGNKIILETSNTGNTGTLMAMHNLTENKLKGLLELGGIPSPSIAISNKLQEGFGNITLLFDKNSINPSNPLNEVFDRDAYTPRVPQVINKYNENISEIAKQLGLEEYRLDDYLNDRNFEDSVDRIVSNSNVREKYLKDNNVEFEERYIDKTPKVSYNQYPAIKEFIINNDITTEKLLNDNNLRNSYVNLVQEFQNNSVFKSLKYVEALNLALDDKIDSVLNKLDEDFNVIKNQEQEIDEVYKMQQKREYFENNSIFRKYVENLLNTINEGKYIKIANEDYLNNDGSRKTFEQLYKPYNLQNILEEMLKKDNVASESNFATFGSLNAVSANRLNSIEEIKANESRLVEKNEEQKQSEELINKTKELVNEIATTNSAYKVDDPFYYINVEIEDSALNALQEIAYSNDFSNKSIKKIFKDNYLDFDKITKSKQNEIVELLKDIKSLSTEYFESKPRRIVGLDEIQQVVIPNNVSEELKQQLQNMEIQYTEYDPNIENDRNRVINQFDNLKFSYGKSNLLPSANDERYSNLMVQNNDINLPINEESNLPIADVNIQNILEQTQQRANKRVKDKVQKAIDRQSYKAVNIATKVGQSYLDFDRNQKKEFKESLSKFIGKTREQLVNVKTMNDIKDIVRNYADKEIKYVDEELQSVKSQIRDIKIKVSDELKNQITDYGYFRKSNFGKLQLGKNGQNIDNVYEELSEMYPYYFSKDITSEADMLYTLSEFMNQDTTIIQKYSLDEATIENAAIKVYNKLVDNTMNKEYVKELQEQLEAKATARTREVVQQELLDEMGITVEDIMNGNDISAPAISRTDPIRLNEKIFGYETGQKINDATVNKVKSNEAQRIRFLNKERQEIEDLGIKARSKESAAVQKYGEKQYINNLGELVEYGDKELANEFQDVETQNKIKNAAKVIRQKYDNYIDSINNVLVDMGYNPIKKRKDYMRHFQALNDVFSRFGTPINKEMLENDSLPTDINGLTDQFKPGKQYFANALERIGMKTEYDAITGIDGYLEGASNLIYHTEDIQRYRTLSKLIRDNFGQTHGFDDFANMTQEQQEQRINDIQSNKLSKYAAWLDEQANALAGKKGKIDRGVEEVFGRKIYGVLDAAKKQVGSNMTGFNVRSALTNFASAVQGASKTNKLAFIKGTLSTIKNIVSRDNLINKSDFLTNRFGSDSLSKKLWQKASNAGQIFMTGSDWFTANQIWRSKYFENLSKGMNETEAIKEADDFASRIMGDRSKGSTATLFNSKTLGFFTQFQLEVNNQWSSLIHDNKIDIQKGNKTAAGVVFQLGELAAFSYFFNNFMKSLTGSDVMIDPIDLFKKLLGDGEDDDKSLEERAEDVLGDIVDDLPFISFMNGGRIPVAEAFNGIGTGIKKITGQKDEYGNDIEWSDVGKDIIESSYYWLLPTGYGQIKKTKQGLSMYDENLPIAGSYTDSGNLRFEADTSIGGQIRSALFGQWSSKEAQEYLDKGYTSLREKDINTIKESGLSVSKYRKYKEKIKNKESNEEKIDYIYNLPLKTEQKNILANNVLNRKGNIDLSNYGEYDSLEEFDYANKNPEKYSIITQITDFKSFNSYKEEISKIKEKYNNTNSKKQAVFKYINSLDLNKYQKLMLQKEAAGYSVSQYKNELRQYINGLNLSKQEKQEIDKELFD